MPLNDDDNDDDDDKRYLAIFESVYIALLLFC
jgi:hypothetical protein